MKHTKGPWKCRPENRVGKYQMFRDIGDGTNKTVISTDEALANAHLIAAAPELLEGIKDALMMCRKHGIDSTWECALEKLIAKATGGAT